MVSESAATESAPADPAVESPADAPRLKKRRTRVRRKQEKFPKPLRIALLLGLPILLWAGIYLVFRALL